VTRSVPISLTVQPNPDLAVKDYAALSPTRDDGWRVPAPGAAPRFGVTNERDIAWMERCLGDHPNRTFTDPVHLSPGKEPVSPTELRAVHEGAIF
jgi:hypothetical protein